MKKMLDNRFLFILGLSVLTLIGLGIGTFYLFNDSSNAFVKSGYVINPLSSKVEKYFFEEETSYKQNLSSMIEFKDIDNKNVTILKDSFLHYTDGGMSFLKNGAILDLNSINGKEAVAFYNITNESIIEKTPDGYVIKTNKDDINLKNFIGRINDDKYIVVGNLEIKIPGNNTNIKGDYFELVFTENGIINIENREVKYQVTAEGTYIYANNVTIDLGNKKIIKNNEDIMSITAITINGDENIEIIPKAKDEKDENGGGTGNNNETDNQTANNGNPTNQEGTNTDETDISHESDLTVSLETAEITSNSITVKFDMLNTIATDNLTLRVTNLETGQTIEKYNSIVANQAYMIPLLSPNTKYLFTVINESDNGKYFQKILETNEFGIKLEKSYATNNTLGYQITKEAGSEITYAKLYLKKFNEETGKNEPVKETYYVEDSEGNMIPKERDRVVELLNLNSNETTHEIFFDQLESDTIYTAVLSDFTTTTYNLENNYEIALTSMTLKKNPDFGNPIWNKDTTANSFKLSIENITDEDNAITNYTYWVYQIDEHGNVSNNPVIPQIEKSDAAPIEIKIGGENGLELDTKYRYKAVIEYFDNEKYLEYITTYSDDFRMETDPHVTIVPNDAVTSYNRIGATIYLIDNSCLINIIDSENCTGPRNAIVQIIDDPTGDNDTNANIITSKNISFDLVDGKLQYNLDIGGLAEGTYYTIRVKAIRNDMPNSGAVKINYTENSAKGIATKTLSTFYVDWHPEESSKKHVINLDSKFIAENTGEISPDVSAMSIKRIEIALYEGNYPSGIHENNQVTPLVPSVKIFNSNAFNIKEEFYDKSYLISNDATFSLDFDALADKSTNHKIQQYYTVLIRAYYDEDGQNPIQLSNNIYSYRVSDILLKEDLGETSIVATPIKQGQSGLYSNLNNTETTIGYSITASFVRNKILAAHLEPKKIKISVYDSNNEAVKFYVMGSNGLELTNTIYEDLESATYYITEIYMDYGKEVSDNIMRRGNNYYIGFEIEVMSTDAEGRISYLPVNESGIPRNYGSYTMVTSEKETPKINMYIAKSTANSVIYRYAIDDPDNALYRENPEDDYYIYYNIDDTEYKTSITSDKDENSPYNVFNGDITIPNLEQGSYYALYIKKSDNTNNGLKYPNIKDDTLKLFEGEYQATDYNFKFTVINNETTDNQVKIKMLASNTILDRIISYKVTFTDTKNNTLQKEFWKLVSCNDESENKCLTVDYYDLREAGMKSDEGSINTITVNVEAIYDNGLTGYDYNVSETGDYKYMIMQGNNTKAGMGKYISFTAGVTNNNTGNTTYNIDFWTDDLGVSKGYYYYSFKDDQTIYYTKILSPQNVQKQLPSFIPSIDGRKTTIRGTEIALNPKMLSIAQMNYENNTFSFSSYTPKIKVENPIRMINGEIVTMTLSGADPSEFCEENQTNTCVNKDKNGEYYLYIEVWENLEDVGDFNKIARPTIKYQINNNNPNGEPITAVIDKLKNSTTYYFRVYAWLNKNNIKNYTQLFDNATSIKDFKTVNYQFKTFDVDNIFSGVTIKSNLVQNGNYGDRELNTEIKLVAYTSQTLKFNYDVTYIICDKSATMEECSPESNSNLKLLTNTIPANKLKIPYTDSLTIPKEFEHNKEYRICVYAVYEYYDMENTNAQIKERSLLLNTTKKTLDKLKTPSFNVERLASYENGEYFVDLTITANDLDKVLTDGKYRVKLLQGDTPVGDMQIMDEFNTYVTIGSNGNYDDYYFDATNTKHIRIKNLSPDTRYTIVVYSTAYINNYDELIPINERTVSIETNPPIVIYSTNSNGVAFGKEVKFSVTEHSIVVTFLGGSNFENVKEVRYTIGAWSNYDAELETFIDENMTYTGSYIIEESNNKFTVNSSGDAQYTISPTGMTNVLGTSYQAIVDFIVKSIDPVTEQQVTTTTRFSDSPVYAKENNQ